MLKLQFFGNMILSNHVLLASSEDSASATMANYLRTKKAFGNNGTSPHYRNLQLHVVRESLLTLEDLDRIYPNSKSFIFLSKHKSDSQIPTLTCHCTGNFSDNLYGGNKKELAISYPSLQKEYLKLLTATRHTVPKYDVIIEATHHGPTSLRKPVLFVELGSTEEQWKDNNAAQLICDTLLSILEKDITPCKKVGIALGGTHYPVKFNKLLLDSEFGLAAIAPKHNLEAVDQSMLNQMITKSIEKVTHIILDGKGLGSHKERIMKITEKTGLEIIKV